MKKRVAINREMRTTGSFEECMEVSMSPVQRDVFLIIDEYWKKFKQSPSLRDIAYLRGRSLSDTHRIVQRLVDLGVVKKLDGAGRTIRPVYINFRNLDV